MLQTFLEHFPDITGNAVDGTKFEKKKFSFEAVLTNLLALDVYPEVTRTFSQGSTTCLHNISEFLFEVLEESPY